MNVRKWLGFSLQVIGTVIAIAVLVGNVRRHGKGVPVLPPWLHTALVWVRLATDLCPMSRGLRPAGFTDVAAKLRPRGVGTVRRRASTETVEPPGRLVTYVEADWLPLVHPSRYLPERHYSHRGQLEGDPGQPSQLWREGEAFRLWTRARHNWVEEHGWPGGWDLIDLMRQEIRLRREVGARAACRVRR